MTVFHFPRGFLWGSATASHQVEGNNTNNNWWQWEQAGKTRDKAGLACDWWGGRWREDMDRAVETGQNAHRFSIEWSRVQPTPDQWDESAIEKYRAMARGMLERGITPMVTLHHFSNPIWLEEKGAWETDAVVPLFEKFVRKIVDALKEYVSLWCTINEPNIYSVAAYVSADFPPGKRNFVLSTRVQANMLKAHAAAYRAIHEIQSIARVGYSLHYRPMIAERPWFPLDVWVRNFRHQGFNLAFPSGIATGTMKTPLGNYRVPEAKGTQDFMGLNYYSIDMVAFHLFRAGDLFGHRYYPKDADLSTTGFIANIPHGLFDSIQWAERMHPNTPLIITENGVEDESDEMRPRYLVQHLHQIWRAVNFNWPVKAYFHWTLVDNFEWERGWSQRFGLWGLDIETQARQRRKSVDLYSEICKENGISRAMVEKYCPEVLEKLFP